MSMSLMMIEPFSGLSRPTRVFRNTDLPVPDGPSRTEISPGGSVSVTSPQMFWLPNDFVSPSTSTSTPTCAYPSAPAALPAPRPAALTSPGSLRCHGPLRIRTTTSRLLTGNDSARLRLRGHGVSVTWSTGPPRLRA